MMGLGDSTRNPVIQWSSSNTGYILVFTHIFGFFFRQSVFRDGSCSIRITSDYTDGHFSTYASHKVAFNVNRLRRLLARKLTANFPPRVPFLLTDLYIFEKDLRSMVECSTIAIDLHV